MEVPSSTGRPPNEQKSLKKIGDSGPSATESPSSKPTISFSTNTTSSESVTHYGQSLASVLNNPRLGKSGIYNHDASWGTWFSASGDSNTEVAPPPLAPGILSEVSKADFQPYLDSIAEPYSRFADVRQHANWEQSTQAAAVAPDGREGSEMRAGQGEGLVACLREIPALYFSEDFALEKGSTFQAACPFSSIPQNMMLQEKLSHYLDLVEVHLVREISARSESFFEALDQLEDLNGRIVGACKEIRELQATVHLLDGDIVESARHLQRSEMRHDNMLELHQKLKLVGFVNQATTTLQLVRPTLLSRRSLPKLIRDFNRHSFTTERQTNVIKL